MTLKPTLGYDANTLSIILPNLSTANNWTEMDRTYVLNQPVRHFRLSAIDEGIDTPPVLPHGFKDDTQNVTFGSVRYDQ